MKELAVVIGRFQPFHIGHKAMVEKALKVAKNVLVVIGCTGGPRTVTNPFTFGERRDMISAVFPEECPRGRISVCWVFDTPYDDTAWACEVRKLTGGLPPEDIALVGHEKDHTSFYLKLFPDWERVVVTPVDGIDATSIREAFLHSANSSRLGKIGVIPEVLQVMNKLPLQDYFNLHEELRAIRKFKDAWDCAATRSYGGPVLCAVDALVESPESFLLIRRGGSFGNDQIAMPGGFLDPHERLWEGALRELKEETQLDLTAFTDWTSDRQMRPFDYPRRSQRGRIITNVAHIMVDHEPAVVGSDDAKVAFWLPKKEFRATSNGFFSDHWHIINSLTKGLYA